MAQCDSFSSALPMVWCSSHGRGLYALATEQQALWRRMSRDEWPVLVVDAGSFRYEMCRNFGSFGSRHGGDLWSGSNMRLEKFLIQLMDWGWELIFVFDGISPEWRPRGASGQKPTMCEQTRMPVVLRSGTIVCHPFSAAWSCRPLYGNWVWPLCKLMKMLMEQWWELHGKRMGWLFRAIRTWCSWIHVVTLICRNFSNMGCRERTPGVRNYWHLCFTLGPPLLRSQVSMYAYLCAITMHSLSPSKNGCFCCCHSCCHSYVFCLQTGQHGCGSKTLLNSAPSWNNT